VKFAAAPINIDAAQLVDGLAKQVRQATAEVTVTHTIGKEGKRVANILADWSAGQTITIYFFGSRVRGDHRADSDVHIYVDWNLPSSETAQWWTDENATDFETLKAHLPGPLKILERADPIGQSVKTAEVVHQEGNVICVWRAPKP
jgi:predicted nucleotidyltransferase